MKKRLYKQEVVYEVIIRRIGFKPLDYAKAGVVHECRE